MRNYKIAAIPADGVSSEAIECGVAVLRALAWRDSDLDFTITPIDWGSDYYYRKHGEMMPRDGLTQLMGFDAIYSGDGMAVGALRTAADMLEQLSEHDAASRLMTAIEQVCARKNGTMASPRQVSAAVAAVILRNGESFGRKAARAGIRAR